MFLWQFFKLKYAEMKSDTMLRDCWQNFREKWVFASVNRL